MNDSTRQERLLDAGLEETFPASDPVSVVCLAPKEDHFPTARPASRRRATTLAVAGSLLAAAAAAATAVMHAQRQEQARAHRRRVGWAVVASAPVAAAVLSVAAWQLRRR